MIEKLRTKAAEMGADAIIVRSANEGTWDRTGGGNTGFERGNAQAVAIKFKPAAPSQQPPENKSNLEARPCTTTRVSHGASIEMGRGPPSAICVPSARD
jgi:hypothetical protein